ncbi:hypothetical protein NQ318_014606 [Aromia moschata]|uniref:Peptidase aspartic putative domain-containing protein n=1 Tax=Aromia moschata TaxID=1265417 RepID=A0AAV8ZAU6_9CUCU|nr:hypothetical protein NQ318_014606 [Aromia moschata]
MAQNKHIREQRALRESLYLRLEDIATVAASFQTEPENHTVRRMLEVRSESVKNIYDDILKIHGDIVMKVATLPDSNLDEEHAFLKRVDETYFTIQSIVRELPVQFRSSAQSPVADKTSIVQTSKTRLPKLNLQTFDGKLENWSAFIQVFNRSIHDNNTLANVERFSGSSGAINETSDSGNTAPAEIVVPTVNALASSLSRQVALLSTALVDVHDSQGHPHTLRVLIDNGSEASFITVKAARNLNLKRQHDKIQIQGIGANSSIFSSGSIHCKISPHGSCQPAIHLEAHIIPHVASVIPSQSLQFYSWDHINNLKLADPNFYISRHVDLLLGADVYAQLIRPGLVLAPSPRCPSAFNTIFGWVLSGSVQPEQTNERVINSFHVKIMEDCPENDLESTMRQFWQVEEVPMISTSPDDELCEKLYVEGYSKLPSGRFVVPLPFRDSKPVFPESKDIAIRRFFRFGASFEKGSCS